MNQLLLYLLSVKFKISSCLHSKRTEFFSYLTLCKDFNPYNVILRGQRSDIFENLKFLQFTTLKRASFSSCIYYTTIHSFRESFNTNVCHT